MGKGTGGAVLVHTTGRIQKPFRGWYRVDTYGDGRGGVLGTVQTSYRRGRVQSHTTRADGLTVLGTDLDWLAGQAAGGADEGWEIDTSDWGR